MTSHRILLPAALLLSGLLAPAGAQFDPAYNHLKCYRIKGARVQKTLVLENQFGRERVVKMVPQLLCVPTKKTCCSNVASVAGCDPIPCPSDPTDHQPAPVDHFKCYKLSARACTDLSDVACTVPGKFPSWAITADLADQFGVEQVRVGPPQLLCAPVRKTVTTPSTTIVTTSTAPPQTTTTVTVPCRLDTSSGAPVCNGACPPGQECLNIPGTSLCECVDEHQRCNPTAVPCGGLCAGVGQQCLPDPIGCSCQP